MRKSTKLKIFRRKKRSVILSVLKRHSLRQHTIFLFRIPKKTGLSQNTKANGTDRGRLLACRYYFVPETGDGRWNGKRWQENLGAL